MYLSFNMRNKTLPHVLITFSRIWWLSFICMSLGFSIYIKILCNKQYYFHVVI